ncbi:SWIM-type domain-containing protein [Mycena venus]|uniref:SWIM-type domain-containing protein n=1 Tax=Mycena venus TaxID=2733690 RepID=A0A8H6ZA11_9AGAR|nr:SWIM-type domain-containing protein [Mycena venus]
MDGDVEGKRKITVSLQHRDSPVHYYDVALPPGAAGMIREGLEWSTPVAMVGKIRAVYPSVTAAQVHSAWTEMSKILWKHAEMKLPSAKLLLKEFGNEVDVLDVHPSEGVEQLCFAMKKIIEPLHGKVVEIGLDATYGTNSKHLELYTVLGEYDNAGFPLSYCLLSTTGTNDLGKRKRALEAWACELRDRYGVIPVFIHVDKDMAEIGMARDVWNAKIQLCWWHLRKAVRTRLQQSKLSTTPYNVHRARAEFPSIDGEFKPHGRADPSEHEGGFLEDMAAASAQPSASATQGPNTVLIKIPATQPRTTALQDVTNTSSTAYLTMPADEMDIDKDNDDEDPKTRRAFCPTELREPIVQLMERHLNTHPLIPGYSHPSPAGIREWAVKQMYNFCFEHDLPEAWAYLWENWYRQGRWELWARAEHPEIPRLKTTMMVESHWRRIKKDFLHHFHKPRVDLLVWILVAKLAPEYYRRLDNLLTNIGRFRQLSSWRKAFKSQWRICQDRPITLPLNEKYRPDPYRWAVQPVDPVFFLEVQRNRTIPFWSHPSLIPLLPPTGTAAATIPARENVVEHNNSNRSGARVAGDSDDSDVEGDDGSDFDSDDDLVGARNDEESHSGNKMFDERLTAYLKTVRDFCDGLEYQRNFQDSRFLATLEREGAGFFRLAENCLSRERRENSTRSPAPTTWERSTANAMFYRSRPSLSDQNT